jgi:deoxycytidylate deaminase
LPCPPPRKKITIGTDERAANECAKFIIQSGIREVRYVRDGDPDSDSSRASRILFGVSGVVATRIEPRASSVVIDFGTGGPTAPSPGDGGGVVAVAVPDASTGRPRRRDEEEMEKYLGLLRREASMDPFQYRVGKRSDYLSWDEYFMGVAFLSGMRSKDPSTQVGACLVDADRRIVGIGYNGFPRGCSDDVLPWARSAPDDLHRKYPYGERLGSMSTVVAFSSAECVPASVRSVAVYRANDNMECASAVFIGPD